MGMGLPSDNGSPASPDEIAQAFAADLEHACRAIDRLYRREKALTRYGVVMAKYDGTLSSLTVEVDWPGIAAGLSAYLRSGGLNDPPGTRLAKLEAAVERYWIEEARR